ncbi:hypothetical protein ZYGR_0AD00990 [Zygosaccharomyces rouxii]|uniref:ZYRO0G08162p n=2 Tax=Zygosaccharomyces rouxii TaxID=4956 RepID=C5DZY3_ZYGRC|nr:uncharacterized protein ZYRO0G08162g [Zygosaccharomyces rouxii]KAH9202413.1 hypothetical protein LQ764DRAFT_21139 [Zygosaccharomyces rouxii]GAV50916.1 hypothetical protein ZYGR_0AD00990 [Zygosaccharomyces rouxii]CAR29417.1 ZYRO0G08162p [Zygosaccharomyces rouxii]
MVKVIYGHSADHFKELKVAGDFSQWEIKPMLKNSEFWEYNFYKGSLPPEAKALHFKFIDDNGIWFTDNDYAKETDANNNENNVRILTAEEIGELGGDDDEMEEAGESSYDINDEGPVRPAPTPTARELKEPNESGELDESTVIVNHADVQEVNRDGERPETSGTVYSQGREVTDQYKTILARIIAFFTNLFRSWFSH